MNSHWSKPALWLSTTLCCCAIAFSAGQGTIPKEDPGEKILNTACTDCHDLRPIETSAMNQEDWTSTVNLMMVKGAEIKKEDVPVLVKYLVSSYGPLPDGPGKSVLLEVCTQCHTLDRIKTRGSTREGWNELLMHMLNEGAPLPDKDYPVLLDYLAKNFKP